MNSPQPLPDVRFVHRRWGDALDPSVRLWMLGINPIQEEQMVNKVTLVGRLAADPEERELPSGDRLGVCRLVVARAEVRVLPSGRKSPSVDVVDLAAWAPRPRRSMSGWREGDEVSVEGALRRRFYRSGERTASRVEVEVSSGRRVRRARTG